MEKKKIFPGLLFAIIEGIPALIGLAKPLLKKKAISDDELNLKNREELFNIVKQNQNENEIPFWFGVVKTAITLGTVYFVIWMSKEFNVTREDIIHLFGLIKQY